MNEAKKMTELLKSDTVTEASVDSSPVGTGQLTLMHAKAESRDGYLLAKRATQPLLALAGNLMAVVS